jgi:transcriptional regulator with XRE-family HTH domain
MKRAIEVGVIGHHVATNVLRLRKVRGLTVKSLSARLAECGRSIPSSGLTRIELGERRVDVDDLVALAAVLGVSPAALLLPLDDEPAKTVQITGAREVPADTAWAWLNNERPLRLPDGDQRTAMLEYQLYSLPPGRRTA